jgi:hypothetical protein
MSFLDRFRGRRSQTEPNSADLIQLEGEELIAAVGESHYQGALLSACGGRHGEPVSHDCSAVLLPEPTNPYDPNAVMVWAGGRHVAYLSRSDAAAYRPAIAAAAAIDHLIACPAQIAARGDIGETANLGIFLHLPAPAEALTAVEGID